MAENEISLTCDKDEKININEEIICRVAVNSNFLYNKINFEVLNTEGIQVIDIRSNYDKRWKVAKNDNIISVSSNEIQSDLQEFGIILIKAVKSGEQDLTLDNLTLENEETTEIKEIDGINKKLKIVSSDNLLKNITVNEKELLGFDSNKTNYTIKIDNEDTIKIGAESNNEFASINGIGEFKLSDKISKFVFPITVVSEDNISKVYVINVVRNNVSEISSETVLDNLIIKNDKGNTLLINFKPNVYEYNIEVDLNTSYLDIKPSLNGDVTFVKNYGEQRKELKSGNNIVLVKVQGKDGNVLTYVINIIKPIANKSSNNYIKSLLIEGYKIKFSKRIKNYTLEINSRDDYLNITPILESDTARYTITGNSNLKDGSIIRIEVTAENEEKTVYKITIKEKKTNYFKSVLLIILGVLGLYILYRLKDRIVSLKKGISRKQIVSSKEIVNVKSNVKKKTVSDTSSTKVVSNNVNKKASVKNKNTSNKNKSTTKTNTKVKNSKKSTNKTNTSRKKVTNSTSSRSPRSNYTKKSPTQRKKTNKKNQGKNKKK